MKKKVIIISFIFIFFCTLLAIYAYNNKIAKGYIAELCSLPNTIIGLIPKDSITWLDFPIDENLDRGGVPGGIRDVTHPSIVCVQNDNGLLTKWMALTPYPQTIVGETYENTCVYYCQERNNNREDVFRSIECNPIILKQGAKYNSDPDLFYDESASTFYCITRKRWGNDYTTKIVMQSSKDGNEWSKPIELFTTDRSTLCPCLVKVDSVYYIFAFNTKDYLSMCESEEIWFSKSLRAPDFQLKSIVPWNQKSISFWHGDVVFHKGSYYITSCAINTRYTYLWGGQDHAKYLWLGKSENGIDWKFYPKPILQLTGVYRSTMYIDGDDEAYVYFSTSNRTFDKYHPAGNKIGTIHFNLSVLFNGQ